MAGQLDAEGRRLGVNGMAAADAKGELMLHGPALKHREQGVHVGEQDIGGAAELHGKAYYEKAEVRDYVTRIVRDLVENYDYDGFQMEWNRTPLCCEPGATQATAE